MIINSKYSLPREIETNIFYLLHDDGYRATSAISPRLSKDPYKHYASQLFHNVVITHMNFEDLTAVLIQATSKKVTGRIKRLVLANRPASWTHDSRVSFRFSSIFRKVSPSLCCLSSWSTYISLVMYWIVWAERTAVSDVEPSHEVYRYKMHPLTTALDLIPIPSSDKYAMMILICSYLDHNFPKKLYQSLQLYLTLPFHTEKDLPR